MSNNKFLTKEGLEYYTEELLENYMPFKIIAKSNEAFSVVLGNNNVNMGKNSLVLGEGLINSEDNALLVGSYVTSAINAGEHRLFGIGTGFTTESETGPITIQKNLVSAGYIEETDSTLVSYFNGRHNFFRLYGDLYIEDKTNSNYDLLPTVADFFKNSTPVLQFGNLQGFGPSSSSPTSAKTKGSWRIWNGKEGGQTELSCNFVPSHDKSLNLGGPINRILNSYQVVADYQLLKPNPIWSAKGLPETIVPNGYEGAISELYEYLMRADLGVEALSVGESIDGWFNMTQIPNGSFIISDVKFSDTEDMFVYLGRTGGQGIAKAYLWFHMKNETPGDTAPTLAASQFSPMIFSIKTYSGGEGGDHNLNIMLLSKHAAGQLG